MCVNVWVHVCGWVAFSILERGIPSADKKRGMLERSDKPWGEGGVAVSLRVHVRICTRARPSMRVHLPTFSGMRWGAGAAQRHELEEVIVPWRSPHAVSFHRCLSFLA